MEKLELIRKAAKHAASGSELVTQMLAAQSFEDQDLVHSERATENILFLVERYHAEMRHVNDLLDQYLDARTNGHSDSQEHTNGHRGSPEASAEPTGDQV